jgi:hypothetical protein
MEPGGSEPVGGTAAERAGGGGGGGGAAARGGGGAAGGAGRAGGAADGTGWTTVASGASVNIVASMASSPSISTRKLTAPKRSSWPERSVVSATRWLSTKVPLALPWSTTIQLRPRFSRRACLRETEPSLSTTSQVVSRPTSTWSWPISMGDPEAGTSRNEAMVPGY